MLRILALGGVLAMAAAMPAGADDAGRFTQDPAATLLLPYFEVELPKKPGKAHGKRRTTIFQVGNAGAAAALAHVTVWSDLAVPVTAFDVYLTGYDIQEIDLFDVVEGRFPQTGDGAVAPGCAGLLPPPPQQDEGFVLHLRAALTGQPSDLLGGLCAGQDYGEKKPVARGYVTVDSVVDCSALFPGNPGYFISGGGGIANNENVLWGDFFLVDRKQKRTAGGPLVHVRADAADPATDGPGDYTFYAGQVDGLGSDNRQPLASSVGGRYTNDPADAFFREGTRLGVWRDPKQRTVPFACEGSPPWYRLNQTEVVVFDDQENAETPSHPVPPPPAPQPLLIPFPAATQLVRVGGPELPVSFERGWFFLNLDTLISGQVPLAAPETAQSWVFVLMDGKKTNALVPTTIFEPAGF